MNDVQGTPLPRWKSHKEVCADKIMEVWSAPLAWRLAGGGMVNVSLALLERVPRDKDVIGGYYVRYADGFESWSPAQAFEEGYTRLDDQPNPAPASSLEQTEWLGAKGATAPRVPLAGIEAKISEKYFAIAAAAVGEPIEIGPQGHPVNPLGLLTLCILVMQNGFVIIGKSAPASPASPANFDAEKGRQFAYEDAVRQLWPLEGYALRERLVEAAAKVPEQR